MSYNKVDPTTGALTKIAGLVDDTGLKADIAEVQAVIPSDASSSNKLVSADTLNGWKGVNKRSPAYKFTRSATKSGCALFADVFGNTFMVSSGDQDVRFSVRQINVVSNNDATKFWRGNGVCYISANTYTLTLIAVFGSLNFEEVSSIISTAPSGTTEFDIATSIPTSTITSGSTAPITSGGVYDALPKTLRITKDGSVTANTEIVLDSTNNWWLLIPRILSISMPVHSTNNGVDLGAVVYIDTSGRLMLHYGATGSTSSYQIVIAYKGNTITV